MKKLTAGILALMLCTAMLPAAAFAETAGTMTRHTTGGWTYSFWSDWVYAGDGEQDYFFVNPDNQMDGMGMVMAVDMRKNKKEIAEKGARAVMTMVIADLFDIDLEEEKEDIVLGGLEGMRFKIDMTFMKMYGVSLLRGSSMFLLLLGGGKIEDPEAKLDELLPLIVTEGPPEAPEEDAEEPAPMTRYTTEGWTYSFWSGWTYVDGEAQDDFYLNPDNPLDGRGMVMVFDMSGHEDEIERMGVSEAMSQVVSGMTQDGLARVEKEDIELGGLKGMRFRMILTGMEMHGVSLLRDSSMFFLLIGGVRVDNPEAKLDELLPLIVTGAEAPVPENEPPAPEQPETDEASGMTLYTTGAWTYGVWPEWAHVRSGDTSDHFYADASRPTEGICIVMTQDAASLMSAAGEQGEQRDLETMAKALTQSLGSGFRSEPADVGGKTALKFELKLYDLIDVKGVLLAGEQDVFALLLGGKQVADPDASLQELLDAIRF